MTKLLIFTAFGPFADVLVNPTQVILDSLQSEYISWPSSLDIDEKIIVEYLIVAVSVEHCLEKMNRIQELVSHYEKSFVLEMIYLIHLGVDSNATCLKMEQFGYNNMTFRIPDVNGYQPTNECINKDCQFNDALKTTFSLSDVLVNMQGLLFFFAVFLYI
jgi:pyrrolidone-carboxylate peptidase